MSASNTCTFFWTRFGPSSDKIQPIPTQVGPNSAKSRPMSDRLFRCSPTLTQSSPNLRRARPELGRLRPTSCQHRPTLDRTRPNSGRLRPHVGKIRPDAVVACQIWTASGPFRIGVGHVRIWFGKLRPRRGRISRSVFQVLGVTADHLEISGGLLHRFLR